MKIFEEGNWGKEGCAVCGKKTAGKVILAVISGTEREGIAEAKQIHLDCIELSYQNNCAGEYLIQII